MKDEMTTRRRVQAILNFQPFDRLPVVEWAGWWDQTLRRWHTEGLPADVTDRYDVCRHFGLDLLVQHGLDSVGPGAPAPKSHGAGIIADEADYDRIHDHLYPLPAVNREAWQRSADQQRRGEIALWFSFEGFFWFPRKLLGIERHLYAFYDQPDLLHRINAELAEWQLQVLDEIYRVCTPEFMTFAEDMSYNHGPMLSRKLFDEFLRPYYERVVPRIRQRGTIPFVDTDGDATMAMPWYEDAGIEGFLPLERQAGVDVAALRNAHPRMRLLGAFDKMTMNRGEAAMRAEFERLLPVARKGGTILGVDHQTPPGVSYQDYRLYVRLFREYARRA